MFQSRIPFNRREPKEQVLPLLQPPLNRLFVPRAHPDFMPSLDKGKDGYLGPRITDHVGRYMWALGRTESDAVKLADPTAKKVGPFSCLDFHLSVASGTSRCSFD